MLIKCPEGVNQATHLTDTIYAPVLIDCNRGYMEEQESMSPYVAAN